MSSPPAKKLRTQSSTHEVSTARPALLRRLLDREIGSNDRLSQIRGIYGDYSFVNSLDIVNELSGHSGCVNALDWSPSGELLASGSDDTYVRLYDYLPESSTDQFKLKANITTGHRANIFSVKFMPHTNERTIITASADCEARVIDIEGGISKGRFHRLQTHDGPVKRIITEDSPFYFLTCSEDGTVRQWDTRVDPGEVEADWPHPLISYAHYNIELRTMSCSPRQPHYIALGGDHLHCFLHDRRMSGRDKVRERGGLFWLGKSTKTTIMEEATRCVRKFAPDGKQRMTKFDSGGLITYGHGITACRISDANPNELIVSWSDDKIYSFDMLQDEPTSCVDQNEVEGHESNSDDESNVAGLEHDGTTEKDPVSGDESSDEEELPPWLVNMSARKKVPCGSHSRSYSGHVNVQTIKDVNYFGLQDEYVVSGSDCGHVFIWDRKSTEIVTILHADEDIVNVIEPHPYEPMIAVSGIDYTVKIFSADFKERSRAAYGEGIFAPLNQRTKAPILGGFCLADVSPGHEFGSNLQSISAMLPSIENDNGLRSRRRTIDPDHPRRPSNLSAADEDDESEEDEYRDDIWPDEDDIQRGWVQR